MRTSRIKTHSSPGSSVSFNRNHVLWMKTRKFNPTTETAAAADPLHFNHPHSFPLPRVCSAHHIHQGAMNRVAKRGRHCLDFQKSPQVRGGGGGVQLPHDPEFVLLRGSGRGHRTESILSTAVVQPLPVPPHYHFRKIT